MTGYFDSPWPCEDAGPARLQAPREGAGLHLRGNERLGCVTRNTCLSTMTVLGAPGEVFLLTHSALRAKLGWATTACVERIDPISLKTVRRSPRLPGGPMWPGGMAIHRNGDIYSVYGRYAHRLNRQCEVLQAFQLPQNQAYNSFVILDNGLIVTKNLSDTSPALLTVLDADTLTPAGPDTLCPEPSIARLSARGNTVYVVGTRTVFRLHWNPQRQQLELDPDWRFDYLADTEQSYGWDVVLSDRDAWFMDNGRHTYQTTMLRAGVTRTANRLIRVGLDDARDHAIHTICGQPGGSITNPPLFDVKRHIVVAYDSANAYLGAWQVDRQTRTLVPLWHKSQFGCASHMILYPDTGELVVNDYRRWGEAVVVLNIANGTELARIRSGGITQGVVFPSVGWGRDFYWSSMGRLARIFVQ